MGASAVLFVTDPACPRTTEQVLESLSYDFIPPAREGRYQLITAKASILTDDRLVIGLDFASTSLTESSTERRRSYSARCGRSAIDV
ncbi:hypothetical protein PI125_g19561 [Phytophthora idaei]|nr:hypothetical protein PI125_g19561 [Phytophthora idaei]